MAVGDIADVPPRERPKRLALDALAIEKSSRQVSAPDRAGPGGSMSLLVESLPRVASIRFGYLRFSRVALVDEDAVAESQ